jgi:hypothetical protein
MTARSSFVWWCILALLFANIGTDVAQQPLPTPAPNKSPISESDVMRAQIAEMKRSEDRILTTVYWALASCGATVLVLVGFSWFVNFKVYERDKESLKEDLATSIRDESEHTKEALGKELNNIFEKRFEELDSRLRANFKVLSHSIRVTMYFDVERDYNESFKSGDYRSSLVYSRGLLFISIALEDGAKITKSIDRMHAVFSHEVTANAEEIASLGEVIAQLPDKYRTDRDALSARVGKLRS